VSAGSDVRTHGAPARPCTRVICPFDPENRTFYLNVRTFSDNVAGKSAGFLTFSETGRALTPNFLTFYPIVRTKCAMVLAKSGKVAGQSVNGRAKSETDAGQSEKVDLKTETDAASSANRRTFCLVCRVSGNLNVARRFNAGTDDVINPPRRVSDA